MHYWRRSNTEYVFEVHCNINREAVYRTIGQYTKGIYPVSTGLVVSALARPEWLVEIDATAVVPA